MNLGPIPKLIDIAAAGQIKLASCIVGHVGLTQNTRNIAESEQNIALLTKLNLFVNF